MKMHLRLLLVSILLLVVCPSASADEYGDSIQTFLSKAFESKDAGLVVGIVDEHGSRIYSAGKLDNGTDKDVDGDTVFEIGSATKTFTALLLEDLVERGEMKLDDPVSKYLPESVTMPTHGGKEITLLNLAAQDSGLPFNPGNFTGANSAERFSSYTVPKMYEFLSGYQLTETPGEKFQYSNLGMGLLGHAMERKTGRDFESLVVERICRPLRMESTCVTLTAALKARLATGHDESGKPCPNWEMPAIAGAGALRSTANDLLKYAAAEVGLADSALTPLMQKTHVLQHHDAQVRDDVPGHSALPWFDEGVYNPPGSELFGHPGGTGGYNSFIGLDLKQRVGVVVLTNQTKVHSSMLGWRILQHAHFDGIDPEKMMALREKIGVGAKLDLDKESHELKIIGAIPNSPADVAGLSTGGLTVRSIDGVNPTGKSLLQCMALIKGPEGAIIRFKLVDQDGNVKTVEIARKKYLIDG
ncbi:MAG TPA: serine hydrolase [Pirellulales bacterium]|jgi:CubicO group peptidase (beta-lactamase class C family)|nr:serine hydrolase [Pirellulales bacterium]